MINIFQVVKLEHEFTSNTELYNDCLQQHSSVLPSGDIVLFADKTERYAEPCKFHLCNRDGNQTRTIDAVCNHVPYGINILPVTIDNKQYICLSCDGCQKIYLINLVENQSKSVCLSSWSHEACKGSVGHMCHGEPGTLFTVGYQFGTVSVLDCTTTKFRLKHQFNTSVAQVNNMCYILPYKLMIISSSLHSRTVAVRESDGSQVWEVMREINGKKCNPYGFVYLPQVDQILVGDGSNRRIIVVEATSGHVVQTIELKEVSYINELHVTKQQQLFVRHSQLDDLVKLSFYSVSFSLSLVNI